VELRQAAPIPLDVHFACAPGQVLGIFGPSGAGKTTILRCIAGLYTPLEAHVQSGGDTWLDTARRVALPAHRRAVGFVFQEHALFPHLTALGNVIMALSHVPSRERRARAAALLDLVHLPRQHHRRPHELSGGERQRVGVARALARDPAVLLLDEPFASVDRSVRRHLHDEIAQLRESLSMPVILVTHDFDDVVRLATHLLVLCEGRGEAFGTLEEMTSRTDIPVVQEAVGLGAVFDAAVSRVLPERGLAELTFDRGTLLASDRSLTPGARVRVRIPARDVILAAEAPTRVSLHNVLRGVVSEVASDPLGEHAVVQLTIGTTRLLAEVTTDAVAQLGIRTGTELHALIKSVSLEVRPTVARPPQ
jgi:molybdate transport system ATP-binding protein